SDSWQWRTSTACDDGDPCTTGTTCSGGSCTGGSAADACGDGLCNCGETYSTCPADCGCAQGANVALSASASSSGGGSEAYGFGPSNMNDGLLQSSCVFHWVDTAETSNAWIRYDWSSSQLLWGFWIDTNYLTSNPCDSNPRTLGSGTIQYWNGSSWVTVQSLSGQVDDWSYQFPDPISTTALRIYDIEVNPSCPSQQTNPIIYEWEVYACE
ncbi:MAG: hypothetical protein R6V85_12735, partial [Polyangia bacterium]